MAVGVAYQTYQLSQEGNLEASYPDYEEEVTVTHIYNKTDFCLIYLQVLLSSNPVITSLLSPIIHF